MIDDVIACFVPSLGCCSACQKNLSAESMGVGGGWEPLGAKYGFALPTFAFRNFAPAGGGRGRPPSGPPRYATFSILRGNAQSSCDALSLPLQTSSKSCRHFVWQTPSKWKRKPSPSAATRYRPSSAAFFSRPRLTKASSDDG